MRSPLVGFGCALLLAACGNSMDHPPDACASGCDATADAGIRDADAGSSDVATTDAPADTSRLDAAADGARDGALDTGGDAVSDARLDGSFGDAAMDARADVPSTEVSMVDVARDTAIADAGHDAGTHGCVSGATGTLAVRFQWYGSGPGSTALVRYLANDLPDTSRWHVDANDRSFGYTPTFDDTFLGAGGLDLEGTAFMDVQISTAGLGSISNVTIAVFGRSFNTTTDGSFSWQTFTGTGAPPIDLVSNVAPYQWYLADATTEFVPGDSGVLLRIYPGPSSNALIVNTVEICFDAR